jgi:exosortase
MATIADDFQDDFSTESSSSGSRANTWAFVAPYLIAIGAQLPMLLLYFRNLWSKPHYQVFPLALVALGVFTYLRWPKEKKRKFQSSRFANLMLLAGLAIGILGYLFVEPWFAASSAAALATSLFTRTVEAETNKSLLSLSLFAWFCVQPPLNGDQRLITLLQTVSAKFTSELLDLVGYAHYMPGTVFVAPGGKSFEVEQACSGVQSFFSLLFVAILLVVMQRRNWFRGGILLLSAAFWAIFMNTVRILAIPAADWTLGWNLASGSSHETLGYLTLLLGILMLLSTDQLLMFVFGPVESFGEERKSTFRGFTKFWNKVISGQSKADEPKTRKEMSKLSQGLIWGTAIILGLGALWNLSDVYRSLNNSNLAVRVFDKQVIVPLTETSLPETLGDWKLPTEKKFETISRAIGSDFGQHSDSWTYFAGPIRAIVSVDQAFPGWHELTTCYKNIGWKEAKGARVAKKPDEEAPGDKEWEYVVVDLTKETGECGFLVFSHFDAFGEGFEAPRSWDLFTSLTNRALNRLNHRVRSRLFRGEAYQVQVFVPSYRPLDDQQKDEIIRNYLEARELLRQEFLKRREAEQGKPQA